MSEEQQEPMISSTMKIVIAIAGVFVVGFAMVVKVNKNRLLKWKPNR